MATRLLFVVNPVSGKRTIAEHMIDVLNVFSKADFDVTVLITQHRGHATEYVEEHSSEFERIVCAGGDGTINEVVSGLQKSGNTHIKVGYIPCGSTNDFGSNFGLDGNVVKSAERAISDDEIVLDCGELNGNSFLYTAAFGAFTDVTYTTPQSFKNVLGHQAYILHAVNHLESIRPTQILVNYGGDDLIEDEFLVGLVTNSERVAGISNLYKGQNVDLADGLFEVLLVKYPRSVLEIQEILSAFVMKKWDSKMFYYFKTRKLKIWGQDKVKWTLDGEFGGEYHISSIENKHSALRLCI